MKNPSPTIAIQGDEASFHDIAARQLFGPEAGRVYCDSFAETFQAVQNSSADYAFCAIENSLFGSINEVYDLLLAHDLSIQGEVYLRVEQCLVGLPGSKIADISTVYSHPVALPQCDEYLTQQLPHATRIEHPDTAGSVALVKKLGDTKNAAIASRQAAELHGMEVLASSIETNKANYTRFVAVGQNSVTTTANKTSLVLETDHAPGALYKAIGVFANRGINISKLQSRPIIGQAWHYMFYVDVQVGRDDVLMQESLQSLADMNCRVTVLGTYQAGDTEIE